METDVDCGGGTCKKCSVGKKCAGSNDNCAQNFCYKNTCGAAGCTNKLKDNDETDVDCGGTSCAGCIATKTCQQDSDCISLVCGGGKCKVPTCFDSVKNGVETDIDCGGITCKKDCEDGDKCLLAKDCVSKVCNTKKLTCSTPTCSDGVKNEVETDVDCGGGTCPACQPGKFCIYPYDCKQEVCTNKICAQPSCTDKVTNGNETDLDCGGSCPKCGAGWSCVAHKDCTSNKCYNKTCAE